MDSMKKIYLLLFSLFLLSSHVGYAMEDSPSWNSEQNDFGEIKIMVKGSDIRVQNANGLTLEVYNITGVKVASYKIDSGDKTVALNLGKGCYIVKVGTLARKISIL